MKWISTFISVFVLQKLKQNFDKKIVLQKT